MKDLINPQNTIQFMKEYGISAKKRFGQNFLIDRRVLERIIEGAEISKQDTVLEIGPGIGTLTQALCEAAAKVYAVEIDRDMIPLLEENLADYDNYEIINDDILKVDIKRLIAGESAEQSHCEEDKSIPYAESTSDIDKENAANRCDSVSSDEDASDSNHSISNKENVSRVKVAANLPYYITTPIIMELLESHLPISSITVMVQKEVADRMQALPGTSDYGALSLAVQYYANAEITAKVPPNCFIPRPGVDSAVITLKCYDKPPVEVRDDGYMFKLIKAAFAQRRKTLVNALKNDASLKLTREQVEAALNKLGLDINIRGERLSLSEFAQLSDALGATH